MQEVGRSSCLPLIRFCELAWAKSESGLPKQEEEDCREEKKEEGEDNSNNAWVRGV